MPRSTMTITTEVSLRKPLKLVCLLLLLYSGCSRQTYREWADRDAYRLLRSRQVDPRWQLSRQTVEPDPRSRLADFNDQDCGPLPPDDPTASGYMRHPYHSHKRVDYWDKRGQLTTIDNEQWLQQLPYNEDGKVKLNQQSTVELALIHSRDFQSRVEQLYASALRLSQNRFEYQLNWFGGNDTNFAASGDGSTASQSLSSTNQIGFGRNLATGGQFATSLVNAFSWQFGGPNLDLGAGNLLVSLTQPILRGAFRHVRTESLTQAERTLLYDVRAFTRFRRQFYFDIVNQYLNLLNQTQSVRIEEDNLRNLELNLLEHQVLLERDMRSPIQVDQVFQRFQAGRLSLINSQQALQTSMDQFKFQLGLPARIEIEFDEIILKPFQLNSPEIETLQENVELLEQALMKYLPQDVAPAELLSESYEKIKTYGAELEMQVPLVRAELKKWTDQIKKPAKTEDDSEQIDYEQQISLAKRLVEDLKGLDAKIESTKSQYAQPLAELDILAKRQESSGSEDEQDQTQPENPAIESWRKLQLLIAQPGGLKDRINTLFVTQTQIRLFLIEIKALKISQSHAIEIAIDSRLDLMNSRAAVVDAYRQIEITANQLESDLSVNTSANLRTDPTKDNPLRLNNDQNQYNVGVNFDGPLNRFGERNGYRLAQIAYQQQRRAYMADEDAIVNSVRLDLRRLKNNRFSFQIARQQLITATRQVEEAQLNLRETSSGDSSLTQDLLQALQSLRDAKNSLISSWINYESSRIALFVDLELLQLDERGNWINEQENFDNILPGGDGERVDIDALGESGNDRRDLEADRQLNTDRDGERSDDGTSEQPVESPSPPAAEPPPSPMDNEGAAIQSGRNRRLGDLPLRR